MIFFYQNPLIRFLDLKPCDNSEGLNVSLGRVNLFNQTTPRWKRVVRDGESELSVFNFRCEDRFTQVSEVCLNLSPHPCFAPALLEKTNREPVFYFGLSCSLDITEVVLKSFQESRFDSGLITYNQKSCSERVVVLWMVGGPDVLKKIRGVINKVMKFSIVKEGQLPAALLEKIMEIVDQSFSRPVNSF